MNNALPHVASASATASAFGFDLGPTFISDEVLVGKSWLFEIVKDDGRLKARVDIYSAIYPEASTPAFDVDKWEAMSLHLWAPTTRKGFRSLARACRALLASRTVHIVDEQGTYCLNLASGVTFISREDDGRAYPLLQSWEQFSHA